MMLIGYEEWVQQPTEGDFSGIVQLIDT